MSWGAVMGLLLLVCVLIEAGVIVALVRRVRLEREVR